MTIERCSCHSESGVPQIRSILDEDVAAENCWRTGDESLDDEHDKDEEMDGSEGDLGGVLAGTVLYIVGEIGGREENREAKDTSTESRCRLANGP
jgi:hypothetical protein